MEESKVQSAEHWLVHDHTVFEVLCAQCREAADISDWWETERLFDELIEKLRFHMAQEEEVLFVAYEEKRQSGFMSSSELRNEHSVMIDSFRRIKSHIRNQSMEDVYEETKALEKLIHDHHAKEEEIFLPFASRLLFEDREELVRKLSNFSITQKSRVWFV